MAFNRDRNFQRGGFKKDFNDRESRGPVTMHQATCSKCGKECEVPFRPTTGKPVYCNNCFDRPRDSDTGRSDSRREESRFSNRPQYSERQNSPGRTEDFETVCDECGKTCTVPFHPTAGKPVYCRECFGDKKNNGERNVEGSNYKQQFEVLNDKLDKILKILTPDIAPKVKKEGTVSNEIVVEPKTEKETPKPKKRKTAKK